MRFLTQEELRAITQRERPSAIRRALLRMGYRFDVGDGGWPVVAWFQVEERQRGAVRTQRRTPRWDKLEVGHAIAAEEGVSQG